MRIGFAGLGRMGQHMARNIAAAGYDLVVWNRTADVAERIASELNCAVAATPCALAGCTDVVVTMLADDSASEAVHLGSEGLFFGRGATTYIEMGTMSPSHITDLIGAAPAGIGIIDAPVSGATQAASDAQLLIMAGCTDADAAPLLPLWGAMGRQVICLDTAGAGAVMKLAVNTMIHGINQTLSEAMTLAEATGIAPDRAFDVIEASAACAPMLKYRRPIYLDEADHDVTFTVALAQKDMRAAVDLAQSRGVAMPQADVTLEVLSNAMMDGFAQRDMAAILNYMRKANT
ncbi:MAG: NAD(P)-dependent oxidoreductase [Yoonia sp.]|nr:NAD(P)-dependent oxidoreductase [Yoonia sp.]